MSDVDYIEARRHATDLMEGRKLWFRQGYLTPARARALALALLAAADAAEAAT